LFPPAKAPQTLLFPAGEYCSIKEPTLALARIAIDELRMKAAVTSGRAINSPWTSAEPIQGDIPMFDLLPSLAAIP